MTSLSWRGRAVLPATLLVLASGLVVSTPAAVSASTGEMHQCRSDEINNGKVMRKITLTNRSFKMTHATRKRVPARTEFSREVALTKRDVVEASIKATASVKADAGAFFAKASVEAGLEVAGRGEKTQESTVRDTFVIRPARRQRVYVFYSGVDTFGFKVHRRKCDRAGQHDSFGKLNSFNSIDETGAVLCPHTRYRKGSISRQVTLRAGC